jgi:hypothetical protein
MRFARWQLIGGRVAPTACRSLRLGCPGQALTYAIVVLIRSGEDHDDPLLSRIERGGVRACVQIVAPPRHAMRNERAR